MTTPAAKQLDTELRDALRSMVWKEGMATFPSLIPRPLYVRLNKAIESMGGKWNHKAQAHLFDGDGEATIREAAETGVFIDLRTAYQFFETPDAVADRLIVELDLGFNRTVLEPSAGKGALIRAIQRDCDRGGPSVSRCCAVEINQAMMAALLQVAATDEIRIADFLTLTIRDLGPFDRIVMNPPFARSQDMAHVRHAYEFLAPGGRLVSVMSPGFTFRSDERAKEFRQWFDDVGGEECSLPDGSFRSSGTNVRTIMVVIGRPAP